MKIPNLPPLAGLCTLEEAAKPGLSVEECVRRLKRFHYAFVRLHGMLTARITAEPIYELKTAFAHHAYLCAEHATAIRQRVSEMREPPLGLDEVPHEALKVFFDEIECAPDTHWLIWGLKLALHSWETAYYDYRYLTHHLTDAPTIRLLEYANREVRKVSNYYPYDLCEIDAQKREWQITVLNVLLEMSQFVVCAMKPLPTIQLSTSSGGQTGIADDDTSPHHASCIPITEGMMIPRKFTLVSHQNDFIPKRDSRFQDLWNQGVNAEAFLYDESKPADAKDLMMLFKRLREIDVPEMMARIITETKGKPWQYYRDMSRQLWDEARHAMMGEVGFTALGVDWTQARITHNWSYRLNTECTPLEAHAVLFYIEQGLMPKTGKRYEFEVAKESGIPLMATIQDFDWADEVLHSQIGRQWLVPEFGNLKDALAYGDAAWSKITSNWATVKELGYTQHENWWPGVYTQYCEKAGKEPDKDVLAYSETYEAKRADIHRRIPAE